jgi:hypothetical protein
MEPDSSVINENLEISKMSFHDRLDEGNRILIAQIANDRVVLYAFFAEFNREFSKRLLVAIKESESSPLVPHLNRDFASDAAGSARY